MAKERNQNRAAAAYVFLQHAPPLVLLCYSSVQYQKRGIGEKHTTGSWSGRGPVLGGGTVLYRNSTKGGALEDFLQLPRGPVVGGKHTTCHSFGTGWHAPFIRVKGTVQQDFGPPFFFIIRTSLGH